MNEPDPGLQAVVDRIGLTPTESLWNEFWWERDEFDLHVKHTVSGHYQGEIYIDIDSYLEVTCRDPACWPASWTPPCRKEPNHD